MTSLNEVVFLIDVDNTLLDNHRVEALEPGEEVPWAAHHQSGVEVPLAARQALEMLEKLKKP